MSMDQAAAYRGELNTCGIRQVVYLPPPPKKSASAEKLTETGTPTKETEESKTSAIKEERKPDKKFVSRKMIVTSNEFANFENIVKILDSLPKVKPIQT